MDEPAFVHAVGLAARSGGSVRGLHVQRGLTREAAPPMAAALLERWQWPRTRVDHASVLSASADDTSDVLLDGIAHVPPALVVMSTHARRDLGQIVASSVAEAVARNVAVPVLLLPTAGPALVEAQSGALQLTRALLACIRSRRTRCPR